jgi:hypothetical protein
VCVVPIRLQGRRSHHGYGILGQEDVRFGVMPSTVCILGLPEPHVSFKLAARSTDGSTMSLKSRVLSRGSMSGRGTAAWYRPYPHATMSIVDETGLSERLQRAADPATPSWVLAELADDADSEVRMAVASNPSASELTLVRLRCDPDPGVRTAFTERVGLRA